jgi:oligoendopeptidase F
MKALMIFAAMLLSTAYAQELFDPFPKGSAGYHFDFSRIFASAEAERADRTVLAREIEQLHAMRGSATRDADRLLLALQRNDDVQIKLARHATYLYLRYAVDTRDEKSRDEGDALEADADAQRAFLKDEILALTDERLAQLLAAQPTLETYRYAIDSIRRWRPHTLSEAEEKLMSAAAPAALNWQFDLYQRLRAQNASPELFAFALVRLASSRNAFARLRHFDDAAAWSYFERGLTRPAVKSLIERVAASAGVYKRYQQLRAEHPRKSAPPRFTIDEARELLLAATAPLGGEYAAQLRALLDPANGRMDIVPGPNRKRGGFSEGAIGTESVFFAAGFSGSYNDVRVLAHESTHAVQRQLMTANGVAMANARGPNYLAEALAIFNELLLADFMAARTGDAFYREQFLDVKGMAAFYIAPEAELEEAVYDGVAAGTIRTAADLDALTARVYGRYTIGTPKEKWMSIPLMYEDPFYDVNYVYGAVIALRMYAMYGHDPKAFAPRYVAFMKNGYTAPAATLLKRFFDIDLVDPLDDVVTLLGARVDELRAAYAR